MDKRVLKKTVRNKSNASLPGKELTKKDGKGNVRKFRNISNLSVTESEGALKPRISRWKKRDYEAWKSQVHLLPRCPDPAPKKIIKDFIRDRKGILSGWDKDDHKKCLQALLSAPISECEKILRNIQTFLPHIPFKRTLRHIEYIGDLLEMKNFKEDRFQEWETAKLKEKSAIARLASLDSKAKIAKEDARIKTLIASRKKEREFQTNTLLLKLNKSKIGDLNPEILMLQDRAIKSVSRTVSEMKRDQVHKTKWPNVFNPLEVPLKKLGKKIAKSELILSAQKNEQTTKESIGPNRKTIRAQISGSGRLINYSGSKSSNNVTMNTWAKEGTKLNRKSLAKIMGKSKSDPNVPYNSTLLDQDGESSDSEPNTEYLKRLMAYEDYKNTYKNDKLRKVAEKKIAEPYKGYGKFGNEGQGDVLDDAMYPVESDEESDSNETGSEDEDSSDSDSSDEEVDEKKESKIFRSDDDCSTFDESEDNYNPTRQRTRRRTRKRTSSSSTLTEFHHEEFVESDEGDLDEMGIEIEGEKFRLLPAKSPFRTSDDFFQDISQKISHLEAEYPVIDPRTRFSLIVPTDKSLFERKLSIQHNMNLMGANESGDIYEEPPQEPNELYINPLQKFSQEKLTEKAIDWLRV